MAKEELSPLGWSVLMGVVLVVGGRDYIIPPGGKDYTWYIFAVYTVNWVIIYATYYLLQEPEKSVETWFLLADDEKLLFDN